MANSNVVRELNLLETIDYTKLNYNQLITEIKSIISAHPKYKTDWQEFLESNAGKMLLETWAFITEKIILRIDFIANQLTLPTSEDPTVIVNLLKLIGYNLSPPSASVVEVVVENTLGTPITVELPAGYQIVTNDLAGESTYFELMAEENDYDTPLKINNKSSEIFYAFNGSKKEDQVTVTQKENFSYTLLNPAIIKDSIRVYLKLNDSGNEVLLKEITSLALAGADEEYPKYTISYSYDFKATISFGQANFGGAFSSIIDGVPETYATLRIVYRSGGGANGNITANAIDITTKIGDYIFRIYNPSSAVGGADGEDVEQAKKIAPLTVKTVEKTVTREDYTTLVTQQNELPVWHINVDSPYENPNLVPYLFNYLYVSPQRTWSNFIKETENLDLISEKPFSIPIAIANEDKATHNQRFLIRLNNFLNMKGFSDLTLKTIKNPSVQVQELGYDNSALKLPSEYSSLSESYQLYFNFLKNKKVTGIENLFRCANFTPFKIRGTLYYKSGYNATALRDSIIAGLRETYKIENMEFGENIQISKLYGYIHSFAGVSYFKLDYPSADLSANIDEILFLIPETIYILIDPIIQSDYGIDITLQRV